MLSCEENGGFSCLLGVYEGFEFESFMDDRALFKGTLKKERVKKERKWYKIEPPKRGYYELKIYLLLCHLRTNEVSVILLLPRRSNIDMVKYHVGVRPT